MKKSLPPSAHQWARGLTAASAVFVWVYMTFLTLGYYAFFSGGFAGSPIDQTARSFANLLVFIVIAYTILTIVLWRRALVWRWFVIAAGLVFFMLLHSYLS